LARNENEGLVVVGAVAQAVAIEIATERIGQVAEAPSM
jgi:hypothetical protein